MLYYIIHKVTILFLWLAALCYIAATLYTNIFIDHQSAWSLRHNDPKHSVCFSVYKGEKPPKFDEVFNSLLKYYKTRNTLPESFSDLLKFDGSLAGVNEEATMYFINLYNYEIEFISTSCNYKKKFGREIINIDLEKIADAVKIYTGKNGAPPERIDKLKECGLAVIPTGPYSSSYLIDSKECIIYCINYCIEQTISSAHGGIETSEKVFQKF